MGLINDANLGKVSGWLGCRMAAAAEVLERDLSLAIHTRPVALQERSRVIEMLRTRAPAIDAEFERLSELEGNIKEFFKPTTKEADSLKDDSLAQLSFTHNELRSLNHLPFILMVTAVFKIWVVPAMTIIFPLVAWILPYILLRFVYAMPITQDQYMGILRTMWTGDIMNPQAMFGAPITDMFTPKSIAQAALFLFSFSQSMIQPIQNAMHLYKTDNIFVTMGNQLLEIRNRIRSLKALGVKLSDALEDLEDDSRRAFILIKEQPERLHVALRSLARLEVLWRIATKTALQPVVFSPLSALSLADAVDISLESGVPSSFELGGDTTHAVITGPNGGGKSSFMRAVLQVVLFGHAYGYAPAAAATLPKLNWIASGLQLRDTPGVLSMFETEVKFAADSLLKGGNGIVLFDELFHSTNAPDGTRTATLFLNQLWARSNIMSVVSTHIFPLIESAPKTVKAVCCQAVDRPDGIEYFYRVEPGVCRVSSVKTVWERFGLSTPLERIAANPLPAKSC